MPQRLSLVPAGVHPSRTVLDRFLRRISGSDPDLIQGAGLVSFSQVDRAVEVEDMDSALRRLA